MIQLKKALSVWGTEEFESILKRDIEQMDVKQLPLQQGLSSSSYALDNNIKAIIINVTEEANIIRVKAGVFYTGVISGCNCADDPTPVDEQSEYCEVQIDINKVTAEAIIILLSD